MVKTQTPFDATFPHNNVYVGDRDEIGNEEFLRDAEITHIVDLSAIKSRPKKVSKLHEDLDIHYKVFVVIDAHDAIEQLPKKTLMRCFVLI